MRSMAAAVCKGLLAILALAIGSSIILWVLYNELVETLPQYRGPMLIGTFGIAPAMILTGLHWGRQALRRGRGRDD